MGYVVLVTGWQSPLVERTVSVKVLPEFHGPYHYPHGSFVEDLSPVRDCKGVCGGDGILAWREACEEALPPVSAAPMAHVAIPA